MLDSQRLQIQAAELRSKINGMSEARENKPEYDELRAKLSKMDKDVAAAIQEEDDGNEKAMAEMKGMPFGQTAETRVCKGSAFQAVCAIWQGVPIEVADRGSRAAHGEVQLFRTHGRAWRTR